MASKNSFDVIVVGGGPIGWASAYEVAKAGKSVVVLEQYTFYNQAGSSGDMARMFRTMYEEEFMAKLAKTAMGDWDNLEKDAGQDLRLMTGLLNFGDPTPGATPEGTLLGPIKNLKKLGMPYQELLPEQIEKRWPFRGLPEKWRGLYAPDNGVINVPLLLRTLSRLAKDYGAVARQHVEVKKLVPEKDSSQSNWKAVCVKTDSEGTEDLDFFGDKIIITPGAYVNHVVEPSFGFRLDIEIWEMTATYFSVNPGPNGTVFPSMWFQFAPNKGTRSQLFYGFPVLPWGPPNIARIAVDAANRTIKDPSERKSTVIDPEDIKDVQDFVKESVVGVDWQAPFFSSNCLQTNVYDNMFVLDFIPEQYLKGGVKDSVILFTAGWAMKFVPLLGRVLKEMALDGHSNEDLDHFKITRSNEKTGQSIIAKPARTDERVVNSLVSTISTPTQAQGSSIVNPELTKTAVLRG